MKKIILSFAASLIFLSGSAQTQILFENFEGGAGDFSLNTTHMGSASNGYNDWVVNSSYTGGSGTIVCVASIPYTIGVTPAQPGGISSANGNYAHILADQMASDGIYNAAFRPADNFNCETPENYFMAMTNDVNTSAFTNVTLSFWWLGDGGADCYGELYYSTDGGNNWTQETTVTNYTGQATWTQATYTNAAWDGQTQLRFGFRFVNVVPTTIIYEPSWSIDDFRIEGTAGPCSDSFSSLTESACFSYTVPSGDETYTTPGTMTVMDTILNVTGCDSIITINLTINEVDTSVTVTPNTITSNASSAAYQWLDCNNSYAQIAGATNSLYTATGNFAVEVTQGGCVDTSSCYNITSLNIEELASGDFRVFPNPSEGNFSIDLTGLKGLQILTVQDLKGSLIYFENISAGSIVVLDLKLGSGVYVVKLSDQYGMIRRAKLIIE